ncbi:MAG TPA: FAD binding domain-containing protein [Planctomycetota bacterium]|nr:FAD binding domain-containing protein [Planctomycetota bacterium]HQB00086.1 FAD binding domain-containing protein [Planctomycetota bacterium]
MRNYLNDYQVLSCSTLEDALCIMQEKPDSIPLAGGTDLMVYLKYNRLVAGRYLNLHSIPELQPKIDIQENQIVFSALTTYRDVRMNPYFKDNMKLLPLVASNIGAMSIQNIGTWVGNIGNASPAADGVLALMLYDAKVHLKSQQGERVILLADFYKGYKQMDRDSHELITAISIPKSAKSTYEYYRKVGERKLQAIAKIAYGIRMYINKDKTVQDSRIVFGSMMPYTYRCRSLETLLQGKKITPDVIQQGVEIIQQELQPIDDIRSTARYRLQVAKNLWKESLESLTNLS